MIVQNRGTATAVIIPYSDYELLQTAREQARKRKAIETLKQVAQEVRAANRDISAEEADKIGAEVTREAIESLVAKGDVAFE